MNDFVEVSLDKLGGGAAVERFNDALQQVIENIVDPNVEVKTVREINLKVKLKPDESDRGKVFYAIEVKTKLAQPLPVGSMLYVGKDKHRVVAYEQDITQPPLFSSDEPGEGKKISLVGDER